MAQSPLACLAPAGDDACVAILTWDTLADVETWVTSLVKDSRPANVLAKDSRNQLSGQGSKITSTVLTTNDFDVNRAAQDLRQKDFP